MPIVEMLEQSIAVVQQLGYGIRYEWLDGRGGGTCEFSGQKWIFIDIAQSPEDQLEQVIELLRSERKLDQLQLSRELRSLIDPRKAA